MAAEGNRYAAKTYWRDVAGRVWFIEPDGARHPQDGDRDVSFLARCVEFDGQPHAAVLHHTVSHVLDEFGPLKKTRRPTHFHP